ncbi:hypothetical protein MKX41_11815 [Paenibacillus sp. FSL R5-0475]|uniref:hypothetical protein n=1 Tax=unclassified Paenibacillus TaxID=185978 RepID=UPI0030F87896
MKDLLSKKKKQSIKLKDELPGRLKSIALLITDKWKEVIKQFIDGAITGFVSELIIFLINNFITTMKRMVRIIKEGLMSLVSMIRFLLNPPEEMLPEEVHHQCMKLGMSILVTSGGILLEEVIEKFLMAQVWIAPIANFHAPVIAGLSTGLILSLLTYGIDKLDCSVHEREKSTDKYRNLSWASFGKLKWS